MSSANGNGTMRADRRPAPWRSWGVAITAVLFALAGYAGASLVPPNFEATAYLSIGPSPAGGAGSADEVWSTISEPELLRAATAQIPGLGDIDAEELVGHLDASEDTDAGLIAIGFSWPDAVVARDAANAVANAYIARRNAEPVAMADPAETEQSIADVESEIADLQERKANFDAAGTPISEREQELEAQLTQRQEEARSVEAEAAALRNALDAGQPVDVVAARLTGEAARELRERRSTLRSRIAELSGERSEDDPDLLQARSDLAEVNGELRAEAERATSVRAEEAAAARQRLDEVQAALRTARSEAAQSQAGEIKALDRQLAERQVRLEKLQTALARVHSGQSAEPAASLVAPANLPSGDGRPNPFILAAASGLLGLAIGFLAALVIGPKRAETGQEDGAGEASDRETTASGEPASALETPILGDDAPIAASTFQASDLAGGGQSVVQLDDLAVAVLRGEVRRVAVLTAGAATAIPAGVELARALTGAGHPSVLIDLSPDGMGTRAMGVRRDTMQTVIVPESRVATADAIDRDHFTETHILPLPGIGTNLTSSTAEKIAAALSILSGVYDCVVLECGAMAPDDLARIAAEDTAVVVAAENAEQGAERMAALEQAGFDDVVQVKIGELAAAAN
ncbi:GumC family protein [Consotaella aegiceratis]|uniref:GumC family protein n=1 Tax=Consotaella aegiceratis TaxID=3097961 RepID=UPI002F42BB03